MMDAIGALIQTIEAIHSACNSGQAPTSESLSILKTLAQEVQLSISCVQNELKDLQASELKLKSTFATERERASNAEAGKAELSIRNRALQVELDSSRSDVVRLKSRLRELDPARPRAGTAGSQVASPPELVHASPPPGRVGVLGPSNADTSERGKDRERERSGMSRSRTQTQESSGSHGSFTNLASLLARTVSNPTTVASAQLKPQARVSPAPARSRSGSAPQPLSPSRVPWPRPVLHQHGTQAAILEAVHYSGRASPLVFTETSAGGMTVETQPLAAAHFRTSQAAANDLRQLQNVLNSSMDDWSSALEPQGPLPPLPRPKPLPPRSALAALVKPKASTAARSSAESGAQGLLPAAVVAPPADVTAVSDSTAGEAALPESVGSPAAVCAPASPTEAPSLEGGDDSIKAAASPAAGPPPPVAWSSVATMWSSWVNSGMQTRLAQQSMPGASSPSAAMPHLAKDSATADSLAPPSPTAAKPNEELAYIGLAVGGAGSYDSSAATIQHAVHNVLENFSLFASMSTVERHIVLASTQRVHAQAGEAVCSYHAPSTSVSEQSLLFIYTGEIALLSPNRSSGAGAGEQGSEITVLKAGAYFSTADVPPGSVAMARTASLLVVLSVSTLYTLLEWFGRARRIERTSHSNVDSVTVLPSLAAMGLFGTKATSSASKTAESKISGVVSAATDLASYLAALRRVSPWIHSLSMPARSGIIPRAGLAGVGKRPSEGAIKKEVEQAHKDLGREGGILVNGEFLPLGTAERLQHFLSHLADVVRSQLLPALQEGKQQAVRGDDMAAAVGVESMVTSLVCDLIIAVSRTVTGGDTFVQVNALFGRPELAFIAAESGGQAPTELSIQGGDVTILAVNTFKVCAMEAEYDVVPEVVEEPSSSRPAARSRASTNASIPGHAGVWALMRCKLEEKLQYGRVGEEQSATAPALSSAYMAMANMWTKPVVQAAAASKANSVAADGQSKAGPAGHTSNQPSSDERVGDMLRLLTSERTLEVSIHVFDKPE